MPTTSCKSGHNAATLSTSAEGGLGVMDWGMLGYFVGAAVEEAIPVLAGRYSQPDLVRCKHFGAAAASSGGVEMYHIVGATPQAATLEQAFGPKRPVATFNYGKAEQRRIYDDLNSKATDPNGKFSSVRDCRRQGVPPAASVQSHRVCRPRSENPLARRSRRTGAPDMHS